VRTKHKELTTSVPAAFPGEYPPSLFAFYVARSPYSFFFILGLFAGQVSLSTQEKFFGFRLLSAFIIDCCASDLDLTTCRRRDVFPLFCCSSKPSRYEHFSRPGRCFDKEQSGPNRLCRAFDHTHSRFLTRLILLPSSLPFFPPWQSDANLNHRWLTVFALAGHRNIPRY